MNCGVGAQDDGERGGKRPANKSAAAVALALALAGSLGAGPGAKLVVVPGAALPSPFKPFQA